MSAPLLLAAMIVERRANRPPARKRHLLVRLAVAALAGATVLAVSAPPAAAWQAEK
jgi:hypothetical protein